MTERVRHTLSYVALAIVGLILAIVVRDALPPLALLFGVPSGMALGFAAGSWVFGDGEVEA